MFNQLSSPIQEQLAPGETLLWAGYPQRGFMLRGADLLAIPFSLMWGGFACFWEWSVLSSASPFFFKLWGIPFVLVGLYIIAGRFAVDALQRDRTAYGVTNERVIIQSGLFNQNIKSLNLRTLSDISLDQKGGGRGTISFGPSHPMAWWYGSMSWPGSRQYAAPSFEMIEDARTVFELIQSAQRRA